MSVLIAFLLMLALFGLRPDLLATMALRRTGYRLPLYVGGAISAVGMLLVALAPPAGMAPHAWLTGAALVLGLMAAGAGMQWGHLQHTRLLSVLLLGIRHLLLPLLAWAVARLLGLDATQTTVLLAFSALPTASSCYVLAARMGYNGPYVAGLVTLSTLLALASLPFALGLPR